MCNRCDKEQSTGQKDFLDKAYIVEHSESANCCLVRLEMGNNYLFYISSGRLSRYKTFLYL